MTILDNLRDELENTPMAELRSLASKKYDIPFNPKSTKQDIITEILARVGRGEATVQAFGALQPGWARVKLHPKGDSDADILVSINGWSGFIPVNKEVDIPIKALEVLKMAQETNYSASAYDPSPNKDGDNVKKVTQYSYPFSVLGVNPGPDPRPSTWQLAREQLIERKRAFAEAHGHWPSNKKVLAEWQAKQKESRG